MPLEYKPNFTSASDGGGFVTGYHGTPDSFTQRDAPDFAGAMKTLAGAVKDFRDDAFEQGKLDQIAGEIDNNKILFKDAYLAGAEYATSFQKMAEFQAYVADESNKALNRGESAEEFYARISPKIAEYRDSYTKIKQVNPEAGSLLTNNLMNVATGALQNYGTARLERAYEHRRAGSITTAAAAFISPLQNAKANPDMLVTAIKQSIPALIQDADSMGIRPEEYVSDVLMAAAKQVAVGLNFNEPTHRAWVNILQGTVRKLVDGGVIDRTKSTELLTLLQTKVSEGQDATINSLLLNAEQATEQGKFTLDYYNRAKQQVAACIADGMSIAKGRSALKELKQLYSDSVGSTNLLKSIPTTTEGQTKQAKAYADSLANLSPAKQVTEVVKATNEFRNPKILKSFTPIWINRFKAAMSSEAKDSPTDLDLESIVALAYSHDNVTASVDLDEVYGDSEFADFMASNANRNLMLSLGKAQTREEVGAIVNSLRKNWQNAKTAISSNLSRKDEDITKDINWFNFPWESGVVNEHGDLGVYTIKGVAKQALRYANAEGRGFASKDGYLDYINKQLIYNSKSGMMLGTYQPFRTAFPELFNVTGLDHLETLSDAVTNAIKKRAISGGFNADNIVAVYDPKLQAFQVFEQDLSMQEGAVEPVATLSRDDLFTELNKSIYKSKVNDQEKNAKAISTIAYSAYDSKAKEPSSTIVNTPSGRILVVDTNGVTMTAMLQGLEAKVKEYSTDAKATESALQEIQIAKDLQGAFTDDTALRNAVEASTGFDYDQLVVDILKPKDEISGAVESAKRLNTSDELSEEDMIAASISAVEKHYGKVAEANAGSSFDVRVGDNVIDSSSIGKFINYVFENTRAPMNPWGDPNILNSDNAHDEIKDTLLNLGRYTYDRINQALVRNTGRSLEAWVDLYKAAGSAMDYKLSSMFASKEYLLSAGDYENMSSYRQPMPVTNAWNKTAFGDLGTEFATYLERHEGFLTDWTNTLSKKDQQNPNLKQVEVIGLGFVRGGYTGWTNSFEAARGNAEKISELTAQFANWYYSNLEGNLDEYGFDLKRLKTEPELKDALFALGSYLWHRGRYNDDYLKCMVLAQSDLNSAIKQLQSTSAYKMAQATRKQDYILGLQAIAKSY